MRGASIDEGMNVALGGTFDPIHDGHRDLFERAFEYGDLTVGLTSDDLATNARYRDRPVRSFGERKQDLEAELEKISETYDQEFEVRELTEPTGIAVEPKFDVLIVSPETKSGGEKINAIREERGLEPLEIEVVEHRKAADDGIISSTRIVEGEIDEHGNIVSDREGVSADHSQ